MSKAKIERGGYQIHNFSLDAGGNLKFVNRRNERLGQSPYSDEQYLGWAIGELSRAVRFGVDESTWPSREDHVRGQAITAAVENDRVIGWAAKQNEDSWLKEKASELILEVTAYGSGVVARRMRGG